MKKIAFLLGFVFLTFLSVQAQTSDPEMVDPNAAEISFNKLVHDYGTIIQNGDGNCEFEFTNTGKEPLILTNCRSSCGCTVPSWPRKPILPGKKEVIKVKYATNRLGTINKSITVSSNAKSHNVVLRIKGKVIPQPKETLPEKNVQNGASPVSGSH